MATLFRKLLASVLAKVLARPCGSTIPRSGEKGAAVNCFVTAIDKGEEPYLIVLGLVGGDLSCIEWNGSRYEIPRTIALADFSQRDFKVTHYYGHSEVRYSGIVDFVLSRACGYPYAKIHIVRALSSFDQYLFNKKKLYTRQRKELLRVLVNHALEGRVEHEPLDLMTDLYSIKWFLHPQGMDQQRRLEFYLDSLVETGELKKMNYKYVVTGYALRAIEEDEEQERKHTESVKMQWRMFWLTLAIVALTVVQAQIVKLPVIIDLSEKVATK